MFTNNIDIDRYIISLLGFNDFLSVALLSKSHLALVENYCKYNIQCVLPNFKRSILHTWRYHYVSFVFSRANQFSSYLNMITLITRNTVMHLADTSLIVEYFFTKNEFVTLKQFIYLMRTATYEQLEKYKNRILKDGSSMSYSDVKDVVCNGGSLNMLKWMINNYHNCNVYTYNIEEIYPFDKMKYLNDNKLVLNEGSYRAPIRNVEDLRYIIKHKINAFHVDLTKILKDSTNDEIRDILSNLDDNIICYNLNLSYIDKGIVDIYLEVCKNKINNLGTTDLILYFLNTGNKTFLEILKARHNVGDIPFAINMLYSRCKSIDDIKTLLNDFNIKHYDNVSIIHTGDIEFIQLCCKHAYNKISISTACMSNIEIFLYFYDHDMIENKENIILTSYELNFIDLNIADFIIKNGYVKLDLELLKNTPSVLTKINIIKYLDKEYGPLDAEFLYHSCDIYNPDILKFYLNKGYKISDYHTYNEIGEGIFDDDSVSKPPKLIYVLMKYNQIPDSYYDNIIDKLENLIKNFYVTNICIKYINKILKLLNLSIEQKKELVRRISSPENKDVIYDVFMSFIYYACETWEIYNDIAIPKLIINNKVETIDLILKLGYNVDNILKFDLGSKLIFYLHTIYMTHEQKEKLIEKTALVNKGDIFYI